MEKGPLVYSAMVLAFALIVLSFLNYLFPDDVEKFGIAAVVVAVLTIIVLVFMLFRVKRVER